MKQQSAAQGGLHSRFLDSLTPTDRTRVFELSEQVAGKLERWAARYPVIRAVRVRPLALSIAAAAPFSSVEALVSTGRVSLWVFTLDDLFDEECESTDDLLHRADAYRAIAANQLTLHSGDSLAKALRDARDDLARYPLFSSLEREWVGALTKTIDGMVREHQWRQDDRHQRADRLPSYEAYLANGRFSIGGPPHVWSAVIATNDPSTPDHLDHLRVMERIASTCIRLANDLRSADKEIAEEKVNSLVLLSLPTREAGLTRAEAAERPMARIRRDVAHGLSELDDLLAHAPTLTGQPEAAIAGIARFVCEFYTRYDYHTFDIPPLPLASASSRKGI
ncbi:MAG: terpene synthase family protein [Chloroflexota bacterium]